MSKPITSIYSNAEELRHSIKKDPITTLLIVMTGLMGELAPNLFKVFVGLTIFYIVYSRVIRLFEIPKLIELDVANMKNEIVKAEENMRGNAIKTKLVILEQRAKVSAQTTIHLIRDGKGGEHQVEQGLAGLEILSKEADVILTKKIQAPYAEFALEEDHKMTSPPLGALASVDKKFSIIEVNQEND